MTSDDCSRDEVSEEDRFRFFDDLNIIEFIILTDALIDYNFHDHVASDVGTNQRFLPPQNFDMQQKLDGISKWTTDNLMQINESKSNFIIYSRSKQEFSTRLYMNNIPLQRLSVVKILGVWLDQDLSWDHNTKQICKKAFSRIQMLSKLKYAGINQNDLITIYKLFIRSVAEYCSSVYHTSLTQQQVKKIELI